MKDNWALTHEWVRTVPVGAELAVCGPTGMRHFGCGYADAERAGLVRVERDHFGVKITRLK